MAKSVVFTILGLLVSLGFLGGWYHTSPAQGSGWLLFAAAVAAIGLLNHIRATGLAVIAGLVLTASFGFTWYNGRVLADSGWVLFVCIVSALGLIEGGDAVVSRPTKNNAGTGGGTNTGSGGNAK